MRRALFAAALVVLAGDRGAAWLQPQPMAPTPLAALADGRQLLKYLVGCALPRGAQATLDVDGERRVFEGELGLAPRWMHAALAPAEQRLVSACLLARANHFARPVRISLRGRNGRVPPALDGARVPTVEAARYARFEGAFFGNVFATPPRAYACTGEAPSPARRAWLESLMRVCTLTPGFPTSEVSRCGMRLVGRCSEPGAFRQDGVDYRDDAVEVWLPASPG